MGCDFYLNPPRPTNEAERAAFARAARAYARAANSSRALPATLRRLHEKMLTAYKAWGGKDKY